MLRLAGVLVLAFVGCIAAESASKYSKFIIDKHNELRAKQGASNMNLLVWNETLAETADNWISGCRFDHENKGYGENLAFNTGDDDMENMKTAFKDWYDEIKDYNYNGKACQMSCHYTQLVWYETRQVGCAIKKCPSLSAFGQQVKDGWFFGCWYFPKGNDVSEYPYIRGKDCADCLDQQTCSPDGLCVEEGKKKCEDKSDNCVMWEASGSCASNKPFMEKNCRQACGFCQGGVKRPCEDKDANCPSYKFSCESNKSWMKPNCPKTCGFC